MFMLQIYLHSNLVGAKYIKDQPTKLVHVRVSISCLC
jgi:hypothetical protein